jgi:threonine dehydratase
MPTVTLAHIRDALQRIRPIVPVSPVKESVFLQKRSGVKTHLKLENLNLSGSFKIRGAVNALTQLPPEDLAKGVIAASAGNHAQSVAYTCKLLGAKSTIFMPVRAPLVKAEATRELGADVQLFGQNYDEAYAAAKAHQEQHGGIFIHAFDDARVIAGQGTIGFELLDQLSDLGMIIVPIGGGGLISGIATVVKSLKPDVRIVGVQSQAYPAIHRSFTDRRFLSCSQGTTIADGIAIKQPSEFTFSLIQQYVDDVITIDEQEIASAVMSLMEWDHMLAEGAGAASVAALLKLSDCKTLPPLAGRSIACIISGGNIDVNLLKRIIPNGLKHSGRLMRLAIRIPDRPGRLAELLNLVGRTGANLADVQHNRLFGAVGYEDVEVQLDLDTLDMHHQDEILAALKQSGFKYSKLD